MTADAAVAEGPDEAVLGANEVRLAGRLAAAAEERALPSGDVLVSFRLVVQAIVRADGPVGVRLDIVAVEADSLGIDLTAPSFVPTTELARSEHWDRTRSVLTALRSSGTVS